MTTLHQPIQYLAEASPPHQLDPNPPTPVSPFESNNPFLPLENLIKGFGNLFLTNRFPLISLPFYKLTNRNLFLINQYLFVDSRYPKLQTRNLFVDSRNPKPQTRNLVVSLGFLKHDFYVS
jgi:hypothetical protein